MCALAALRSAGGVWVLFFLPDALVPLRLFAAGWVLGGDVKVFVISTDVLASWMLSERKWCKHIYDIWTVKRCARGENHKYKQKVTNC